MRSSIGRGHSVSLTLADLAFEDLLHFLSDRRLTGTLSIETRSARKKVYVFDGQLAGVSSNNPRDLLGHFLVGWGLISEEQLREGMQIQEKIGTPLGRILERMGAVDGHSMENALRAQAEEALLDLFLMPHVEKHFLENVIPADRPVSLRIPIPPLVLEGLRRRQEMTDIEETLGTLSAAPRRTDREPPSGLAGRELHVLAEIDGERDINALALTCHLPAFHVAEFVTRGLREGFLAIARTSTQAAPSDGPAELLTWAENVLARGDLRACWDTLQRLRAANADHATRARTEALREALAEALSLLRERQELVPQVAARPASAPPPELRPDEAFVFSRINGSWTVREIGRVTPLEELHFGVVVDSLLRAHLIDLHLPTGGLAPYRPIG